MMGDLGDALGAAIFTFVVFWVIVVSLVVGLIAFFAGRQSVDTIESAKAKVERQQIIDSLTDEQRKVLGL